MILGKIDSSERVVIVGEIGNNHEGRFDVAKELIARARDAGLDAVKFQTFRTEYYVSSADANRFARLKSFELEFSQFEKLSEIARNAGLLFLSTPFDLESARFLTPLVDGLKIASGDNNFYPLLDAVAQAKKPTIVSTGATDLNGVYRTVSFIQDRWSALGHRGQLGVLHCVSSYPVPEEEASVRAVELIAEIPGITPGYSDHTIGIDAAILAVGLGARIIEKHFTLDKNYSDFRDHKLSADPAEMAELVRKIRQATRLLGVREKVLRPCERDMVGAIRRSIVAAAPLGSGHRIVAQDLTWIRPAGGLSPGEEHRLVGRTLLRNVKFGEMIRLADVQ